MGDSVASQIAALKSAYATLSDVLVEETDTCHNGIKALNEAVHSRSREIQLLQDNEQRLAKGIRSLESDVADIRREGLQVEHKAEDAVSLARSTEASTREAIIMMQQQVAQLAARCSAAEQRAAAAEERASDAEHRAAAAEERSGAAEEAMRQCIQENRSAQSQLASLSSKADVATKDTDRQVRDLDRRYQQLADALRDMQSHLSSSISNGLSTVNATLDRVSKDTVLNQSQLSNLEKQFNMHRQQSVEADASLAADVAMLSDKISQASTSLSSDVSALSTRISAVASATEETRRLEADERERRIAALSRTVSAEIEQVRRAVDNSDKSLQRVREVAEEHGRLSASESRAASTQVSSLEGLVNGQLAEQSRRLDEVVKNNAARLDAMSNALHAFANVLNLGQVVIDPRSVLSKSLTSAGIASPSASGSIGMSSSMRSTVPTNPAASPGRVSFAPSFGVSGPSNVLLSAAGGDTPGARRTGYGFTVPLSSHS